MGVERRGKQAQERGIQGDSQLVLGANFIRKKK
jgi:hypothetical protein